LIMIITDSRIKSKWIDMINLLDDTKI
jgi:hypothetical protein